MAWIALEGMQFHAFHGVHEPEKILGTDYLVDVYVRTKIDKPGSSDNLEETVNYETIYQICRMEMDNPRNLLEAVVSGIIGKMKHQFEGMEALRVRIRKLNPPVGGAVEMAWVMEELDFTRECPRCRSRYIAYEKDDCWDKHPNLHPATREMLMRQYGGACLCDTCLQYYAG